MLLYIFHHCEHVLYDINSKNLTSHVHYIRMYLCGVLNTISINVLIGCNRKLTSTLWDGLSIALMGYSMCISVRMYSTLVEILMGSPA